MNRPTNIDTKFVKTALECPYCGTTHGLRIKSVNPRTGEIDPICSDCFTGMDDGPCFDDLKPVEISIGEVKTSRDWQRWARERREYEEPYAPIGGRY